MSHVESIITPSSFKTTTIPDPEVRVLVTTTQTTQTDPETRILVTTTTVAPCDISPEEFEFESKLPNSGQLLCRVAHAAAAAREVHRRRGTLMLRPMCPPMKRQ
ncbi:hypothetical protein C8R43DRAFT_949379 [Mycena crocata]|nr:hypothetical protein C8R43DRAFT_949379 [Mycena crocata]